MNDSEQDEAQMKAEADAALARLDGTLDALDAKGRAAAAMLAPLRYHPMTVAAGLGASLLLVISGFVFAIRGRRKPRSTMERIARAWQVLTEA